ncbi:hypothetical protein [Chamaesiphon minutus]|nr:hypothetical protein [Chamaesiphon minutus]
MSAVETICLMGCVKLSTFNSAIADNDRYNNQQVVNSMDLNGKYRY